MSELALKLIKEAKEKRLTRLDLGNCGLTELPDELFELVWLEELILSNKWYDIASDYNQLDWINSKNQGKGNNIKYINPSIVKITELKTLILNGTFEDVWDLKDISPLSGLLNLSSLSLFHTKVKNLITFTKLKKLQKVYFDANENSDLSHLNELLDLQILFVYYSRKCLLYTMSDIISDETININNIISNQSINLSGFKNLKNLQSTVVFCDFFYNLTQLSNLNDLTQFSINANIKVHIHDYYNSTLLVYLNNIIDLNPLKDSKDLKLLEINYENLYYFENLQTTNIIIFLNNKTNLSPLEDLIHLETLKVPSKGEANFEYGVMEESNIFFTSNSLEDLKSFVNLKNLRTLEIPYGNDINISGMARVNNLSIDTDFNIGATDLSLLKDLQNLESLDVNGLNIINPPKAIIEKGIGAIKRYFKELENKESVINNKTKLIFIGNSRAGKTSLLHFLKDQIYQNQVDSTHGIKTEIWDTEKLGTEDKQNLVVHIWDFGGQEYYHATHRLYLTENAVYVLVWEKESNKQGSKLEHLKPNKETKKEFEEVHLEHFPASYWLENIRYFGGNHCPVLIVQNKVDEEALKANYTEGGKNAPDCFHLSVKNAFEFQQGNIELEESNMDFQRFKLRLLKELRKNATAFKLVKYYAQVREALEAKAKDTEYIAVSELKDIALQFDETPDLENLLAYLNSFTNTVLYFPQNELLKDKLYLNPTHISRDIYKIFNKTVRENNGKFDRAHIQTRLNCDAPQAERFVALMKEFDLVFEKSKIQQAGAQPKLVTPQYLPKKEELDDTIQFLIDGYNFETGFYLQFKSFVPRSMMLRFIANNGAFANQETYWHNGIIYKSNLTKSVIKVEYDHDKSIFCISVQDRIKQLADIQNIVAQFVKLNDSDDKIELSNDGHAYFELRKIYTAHNQNRKEIDNNAGQYTPLSVFNWIIEKQEKTMTQEAFNNLVRNYVGDGRTDKAFTSLLEWAQENGDSKIKNAILALRNQWKDNETESSMGRLSYDEANRTRARIVKAILEIADKLEGVNDPQSGAEPDPLEKPITANTKVKILMLTANPTNQARLRLDSEHSNILQELQEKQEQFTFVIKKGVSKSEFQKLTIKEKPNILHFSGHGESSEYGAGGLILQDTDGKEDAMPANGLSVLFRFFKSENIIIKVAILNACYSEEQAQAICVHVPYVIGTTLNIGDTAAIAFSTGFYYKLAENGTIEQAFNAGITRAAMDGADETYFALYKDGQKMPISF